ncbi:MAG TPA: carboxy terminal-processing peptidase [Gammaproteobacteria bacterium]|nr:carboxy terminal-processing peptidase [Gammaproteobacteria bacterium]
MRHKSLLVLTVVSLLLLGVSAIPATSSPVTAPAASSLSAAPLPVISPQPRETLVDQAIAGLLTRYHYGHAALNSTLSEQIFKHYLEDLDPSRSYFLQSDIDSFAKYRDELADAIRRGNLRPAFNMYNVYQTRVSERIAYALSLLDHEPDFTVKDSYTYDRRKTPWAKTPAEMNTLWQQRVKGDALGLLLAGKSWKQTADILRKRYRNFEHRARQVTDGDVFDLFMNSYTRSLDPHTDYFSPDQSKEFEIQMSLKLQGIGAALVTDGEYTKVERVILGGPAARSKALHPDDRITGVAQGDKSDIVDVVGWRLDDVVALIRGNPGSVVRLQILPAGAAPGSPEKVIRLVRDTVKLEAQAAHQHIITVKDGNKTYKVGVVTIPTFYSDFQGRMEGEKDYNSTTRDVRRLLKELEAAHVDSVVIDLRNNGGGSLQEADDLTGLFIPPGPVVQIRDSDGRLDVEGDDHSGVTYTGPLAVLVNRFTASASEIFAAAIQDYHRGLIIGSTTYGKGTVQTLIDLNRIIPGDEDAGQLKLTVEKFYRVNGASTQRKGVTPDITLPSIIDPTEFGEETQDSALPWDQIAATDYTPLHLGLDQALPKLLKLHAARIAHDKAWALYLQQLKQYQAQRDEKSISLVLSERKQQRAELDKQRLEMANAWRQLKGLAPAATLEAALKSAQNAETANGSGSDEDAATASGDENSENGLEPDVILNAAAHIVIDMKLLGVGSLPATSQTPADTVAKH